MDENGWKTVTASTRATDEGQRDIYYEPGGFEDENQGEPSAAYVVSDTPILIHQIKLTHTH